MKWYENLAEGVITLVPTPRFLKELNDNYRELDFVMISPTFGTGDEWYKFIEVYGDDLGEYFYQFDSLQDLKSIIEKDDIDVNNVRERGPVRMQKLREASLESWKNVLRKE